MANHKISSNFVAPRPYTQSSIPDKPLIPGDFQMNERIDHYMVTTFYGPVYMLVRACYQGMLSVCYAMKGKPSETRNKHERYSRAFLFLAKEVMLLLDEYGMVLPVPKMMEETLPELYQVVTPSTDDTTLYASLTWFQRLKAGRFETKSGWSNIPMMMWVVANMIASCAVEVVFDKKTVFNTTSDWRPSKSDYVPTFKVDKTEYKLSGFVKFMLFEVSDPKKKTTRVLQLRKNISILLAGRDKSKLYKAMKKAMFREKTVTDTDDQESEGEQEADGKASTPARNAANEKQRASKRKRNSPDRLIPAEVVKRAQKSEEKSDEDDDDEYSNEETSKRDVLQTLKRARKPEKESDENDDDEYSDEKTKRAQKPEKESDEVDNDKYSDDMVKNKESFLNQVPQSKVEELAIVRPRTRRRAQDPLDLNGAGKDTLIHHFPDGGDDNSEGNNTTAVPSAGDSSSCDSTVFLNARHKNKSRQAPRRKARKSERQRGSLKASETAVPTKKHSDLEPSVDLRHPHFYWRMNDFLNLGYLPKSMTIEDVKTRLQTNIGKWYLAVATYDFFNEKKGVSLNQLLLIPWKAILGTKEDNDWKQILRQIDSMTKHVTEVGKRVNPSSEKYPAKEATSLKEYINNLVTSEFPVSVGIVGEGKENLERFCFNPNNFNDLNNSDTELLLAQMHTYKASAMYDSLLCCIFSNRDGEDLLAAAKGDHTNKKLYPSRSLARKLEWEESFNQLVWSLNDLHVFSESPKEDATSFLDELENRTELLWNPIVDEPDTSYFFPTAFGISLSKKTAQLPESDHDRYSISTVEIGGHDSYKTELLKEIKAMFFHPVEGYMRRDLREKINFDKPHGFVMFKGHFQMDMRFYISFKQMSLDEVGMSFGSVVWHH